MSRKKGNSVSVNQTRRLVEITARVHQMKKKARETSSSGSVFDSLTDEMLDAAEMTQNLEVKLEKILKRIVDIDTKLERLDEINQLEGTLKNCLAEEIIFSSNFFFKIWL